MTTLSNFFFFLYAIAKVLVLCGFLPGVALAILGEHYGFRIVAFGVEQVRSESRHSALKDSGRAVSPALSSGNKPARNIWRHA